MYAKWIHPKRIIPFEGDVLRHDGRITVNPSRLELMGAGYYPVILKEDERVDDDGIIFYEKNKEIHVTREENVEK